MAILAQARQRKRLHRSLAWVLGAGCTLGLLLPILLPLAASSHRFILAAGAYNFETALIDLGGWASPPYLRFGPQHWGSLGPGGWAVTLYVGRHAHTTSWARVRFGDRDTDGSYFFRISH